MFSFTAGGRILPDAAVEAGRKRGADRFKLADDQRLAGAPGLFLRPERFTPGLQLRASHNRAEAGDSFDPGGARKPGELHAEAVIASRPRRSARWRRSMPKMRYR